MPTLAVRHAARLISQRFSTHSVFSDVENFVCEIPISYFHVSLSDKSMRWVSFSSTQHQSGFSFAGGHSVIFCLVEKSASQFKKDEYTFPNLRAG